MGPSQLYMYSRQPGRGRRERRRRVNRVLGGIVGRKPEGKFMETCNTYINLHILSRNYCGQACHTYISLVVSKKKKDCCLSNSLWHFGIDSQMIRKCPCFSQNKYQSYNLRCSRNRYSADIVSAQGKQHLPKKRHNGILIQVLSVTNLHHAWPNSFKPWGPLIQFNMIRIRMYLSSPIIFASARKSIRLFTLKEKKDKRESYSIKRE